MIRIVVIIVFAFFSCNKKESRKFKTINNNGLTAKGYVINDSIFDDTVKYYDAKNNLVRKNFYRNGKIEGTSIEYYENGIPKIKTNYTAGYKNGYEFFFDSIGNCIYKGNYYFDLVAGPILLYGPNETLNRYLFVNLQNETLLDIDYRTWNGIKKIALECINYVSAFEKADTTGQLSLLLYLIRPPKFSFEYSIMKVNRNTETKVSVIDNINSSNYFKDLTLPILPDSIYYSIRLTVFDSILNKKTILYKEI